MSDRGGVPSPTYADTGVDEALEQSVFARVMRPWLSRTAVRSPMVTNIEGMSSGYFATLLELPPGPPLALTTDGVGTKILLARVTEAYESIGIDCVANNVNDLLCVGAVPLVLLDYIATDRIDEHVIEQVAKGLYRGANMAGIAIPGGEIAQVGAMLAAATGGGPMLDLVGTAVGALPSEGDTWRRPIDGSDVRPGDVVVGIESSGLHSNGYSLIRHLVGNGHINLDDTMPGTNEQWADVLMRPSYIYVDAIDALWSASIIPHGLVNISGGGLLNLGRLDAPVSYVLDGLPGLSPVFEAIESLGAFDMPTIYSTLNMGVGFCVVVAPDDAERAVESVAAASEMTCSVIGRVIDKPGKAVSIPSKGLIGEGDEFFE